MTLDTKELLDAKDDPSIDEMLTAKLISVDPEEEDCVCKWMIDNWNFETDSEIG